MFGYNDDESPCNSSFASVPSSPVTDGPTLSSVKRVLFPDSDGSGSSRKRLKLDLDESKPNGEEGSPELESMETNAEDTHECYTLPSDQDFEEVIVICDDSDQICFDQDHLLLVDIPDAQNSDPVGNYQFYPIYYESDLGDVARYETIS